MYLSKTTEDRESEIAIQSLAQKVTMEQTTSILESILIWIILQYLDNGSFHIPYIGDISIEHKGEVISQGQKEAKLSIHVAPSDLLKRLIGQIDDNKESDIDIAFIEKILFEIESKLEE